jgi:hypothetical protein
MNKSLNKFIQLKIVLIWLLRLKTLKKLRKNNRETNE